MDSDARDVEVSSRQRLDVSRPDLVLVAVVAVLFGSAALATFFVGGFVASSVMPVVLAAVTAVAMFARGRRSLGSARLMWMSLGVGMSFNALGDLAFQYVLATTSQLPDLSVADVGYLLTYPFVFVGVAIIVRERSRATVRDVIVDACTVAVVAGLVIWQFLVVNPGLTEDGPLAQRIVFSSYPMMDVLIVGALVGLLLSPGRRTGSSSLLAGFVLAFLANDVFYNLIQVAGADHLANVSDAGYTVAYGLLTASAAHRSAATLESEAGVRHLGVSRPRMVLLGVALVGAPAMAVLTPRLGLQHQAPVYIAAAALVSVLVLSRLISLVRSLDREQHRLAQAESRLAHQVHHDGLTGLPNRVLLLEHLNRAMATSDSTGDLVVLFIDLDRFKSVNDRLGHRAGDELLRATGERIRSCVGSNDLVGRLSGDEFIVISETSPDGGHDLRLADSIVDTLGTPIKIGKDVVMGSGSVGIARYSTQRDASALLRDADLALYEAKAAGGRCVAVFDAAMRARADDRQAIEVGLRAALRDGGLDVAYQPLRALQTGETVGVEALLRWPGRPDLPINDAIAVAESCGLIGQLGDWVLRRACTDVAELNRRAGSAVSVAVNVSVLQLSQPDFSEHVRAALAECELDPSLLTLELTETFLADDPGRAAQILSQLRSLGVRLEIDDFGVGYSSLSRLSVFALDGLKIDRSFTAGLGHDATANSVMSAIIALARSLDLTVTAEGVETADQASMLESMQCEYAQGYYFARPMPLPQLGALLGDSPLIATR